MKNKKENENHVPKSKFPLQQHYRYMLTSLDKQSDLIHTLPMMECQPTSLPEDDGAYQVHVQNIKKLNQFMLLDYIRES